MRQSAAGSKNDDSKIYSDGMNTIRDIVWDEVFASWAEREEQSPGWIKVATEVKGWPDWRSWRSFSAAQMKLPERQWTLYEFTDPMREIPAMHVGPYSGWQSKLPIANVGSFADLIAIPKEFEFYLANANLKRIAENYPAHTQMIGLRRLDGKIVCLEGHHRAVCVALAARRGETIHFSQPMQIAIADLQLGEEDLFDRVLARGTSKDPKPAT
jgi:hypothetical protein